MPEPTEAKLTEVISSGVTDDGRMVLNFEVEVDGKRIQLGFGADPQMASKLTLAVMTATGAQRTQLSSRMGGAENAQTMAPAVAPKVEHFMFGRGERQDGTSETVMILKMEGGFELVTGLDDNTALALAEQLKMAANDKAGFGTSN